ncbi:MAG: metallophosphoesterase [Deltaproteobacteria bacterium]|nr:metallophosphoesterase [Deltaproteobacteria bacterium]
MSIPARLTRYLLPALMVGALACKDKSQEPVKKPIEPVQSAPVAPVSAPAGDSNEQSCIGPFRTDGLEKTIEIAGKSYALKGDVLTLKTSDPDNVYTIGHLTDIKEDTPENLENIKRLLAWFETEKTDAVVITGDLGESQPAIEKVMRAVAAFKGPVFVMIGNREGYTDFEKAYDAVKEGLSNLFNMNHLRVFNSDDASLVSMPGYFNPAYIHSQDGCRYTQADVTALESVLKAATSTVVLASHGPPRQDSNTGIDRIHEGVNVGDPALTKVLGEKRVHFGLFGNIHEAGGKATNLAGDEEIRPDTFVSDLYLNPGPTDAVRWPMLDGTESIGMGGLLQIKGRQGMYKIHRLRPGEVAAPVPKGPATP